MRCGFRSAYLLDGPHHEYDAKGLRQRVDGVLQEATNFRPGGIRLWIAHRKGSKHCHPRISLFHRRIDRLQVDCRPASTPARQRFYHDGRFATLGDVLSHYDNHLSLRLSDHEKRDLVEYLKSI